MVSSNEKSVVGNHNRNQDDDEAKGGREDQGERGEAGHELRPFSFDMDPKRVSTIHPKGDLILEVGQAGRSGKRTIITLCDTVKHSSPEFKVAVGKSTRNGLFNLARTIHLPDDDADMMLVLMQISHANFNQVPTRLDFAQLLEMARLCEKYGMNEKVRPFLLGWIAPHQEKILEPGHEQWLTIAQQFGLEQDYFRLAKHLVLNCQVSRDGQLLVPGSDQRLKGHFDANTICELAPCWEYEGTC